MYVIIFHLFLALIFLHKALQAIITTAWGITEKAETKALQLANMEVLVNAVLYNPAATMHIMESFNPGIARAFFDKWFTFINSENKLPRVHDKRLSILALCALLEMIPTAVPTSVKDGWPGIVAGALTLFKDFPRAVAGTRVYFSLWV